MKKQLFVDSDIILDLLAQREPFYDHAAALFTFAYNNKMELYTTAVVLANVFYILRKTKGNDGTKQQLKYLRLLINVLPINANIVDMSLDSKFSDFEDGLQYFTAKENNIFAIITRNDAGYKIKDIIIQTAEEYIKTNKKLLENNNKD